MKQRLLNAFLNADALGLVLVLLAMQVLLYGMGTVIRGIQTQNLFWICLIAAAIGLSGCIAKWNAKLVSVLIVLLGVITVWILGARIAGPLMDLIRYLFVAGPRILPHINYYFDIDASGITASWNTISVSSAALLTRIQMTITAASDKFQVNDALIRNMLWTFTLWLLSAWSGWFAAKRNGFASLLPGVVLLTVLVASTDRRVESLWALVMIMLLLMGIWNYKKHVHYWEAHQFDYSDSIRLDMGQYVLMVAIVVGLTSYITPSISWRDIRDYFREHEQPGQTEPVASSPHQTNTTAPAGKPSPGSALPRQHLLTTGSAQSEELVMTIKTGELPAVPMQSPAVIAPRYYWRSVVYDHYDGRGWFTSPAPSQPIAAHQPMIAGVLTDYKLLQLQVHLQQPEGKLYWSGMLYSADIPLVVDWRLRPQPNLFADQTDLLEPDMFAARTKARDYKADAYVPIASIQQLRAAPSDDYPERIRTRYLSLPNALPERVHGLASQITEGQPTVYDKAKAIETYLRTNYAYDLEIPAPPEDQDVADYFLFDLKKGYCDYYATAMVVLARSSGIPARFVSGYASGDYDVTNAQYLVRELHAHSWAEVYFPEIGWVEFEPTGNQPEIERQENALPLSSNDDLPSITRSIFPALINWKPSAFFIPLAVLLVMAINYFTWFESFYISRLAPVDAIEILYRRLYRSGRGLIKESSYAETAYEFAAKLTRRIEIIDADLKRSSNIMQNDVTDLTSIYLAALFSNHAVEHRHIKHALMIWKRLRWSLMLERVKYFLWIRNKSS